MERRHTIKNLFPDHLQDNIDYSIFIDMTAEELGLVADYVELFSSLGSVSDTPEQFLKSITYPLGYDYTDSKESDVQREAFKRILSAYEQRGTEESILKAADYAISDEWVAGDVFTDKKYIPQRFASILYPGRNLFRHSISTHSGSDKFADGVRWRNGVMILQVNNLNDRIRGALRTVIPAGILYYFDLVTDTGGSGDSEGEFSEVTFGDWTIFDEQVIIYHPRMKRELDTLVFSTRGSNRLRSGRQMVFGFTDLESIIGASTLPDNAIPYDYEEDSMIRILHYIDYYIHGYEERIFHQGLPRRSENSSIRSGKLGMSGTRTGEVSQLFEIQEISPFDNLYPVSLVINKRVGDFLKDYVPEAVVEVHYDNPKIYDGGKLELEQDLNKVVRGGTTDKWNHVKRTIEGGRI